MGQLGVPELVIILAVLLVVTGGRRLPEVAAAIGRSIRELRDAVEADDAPREDGTHRPEDG